MFPFHQLRLLEVVKDHLLQQIPQELEHLKVGQLPPPPIPPEQLEQLALVELVQAQPQEPQLLVRLDPLLLQAQAQ